MYHKNADDPEGTPKKNTTRRPFLGEEKEIQPKTILRKQENI
jgi:hypothetical protein